MKKCNYDFEFEFVVERERVSAFERHSLLKIHSSGKKTFEHGSVDVLLRKQSRKEEAKTNHLSLLPSVSTSTLWENYFIV